MLIKVFNFLIAFLLITSAIGAEQIIPLGLQAQIKSLEDVFQKMKVGDFPSATLALSQMTSLTKEEREMLTSNLETKHAESEKIFGKLRFFKIVGVEMKFDYIARVRLLEFYENNGYVWNINFIYNGETWHLTSFEWMQPSKIWGQGE